MTIVPQDRDENEEVERRAPMANQTNIHKKMDKILQKLETLEDNDKALAKQTNYLAQLVVLAKQDSARQHQESQAMMARLGQQSDDIAKMTAEALRLGRETSERVAEILSTTRKH